jgi:hypothetical protein
VLSHQLIDAPASRVVCATASNRKQPRRVDSLGGRMRVLLPFQLGSVVDAAADCRMLGRIQQSRGDDESAPRRPEHHWARGRAGRSGRPLRWPTESARRRLAGSMLTTARLAIRASRRRELDRCFRPSLRSSPPSGPTRSVPAKALLEADGVARPSLQPSGLAVSAELVGPMARRSGIGGLAGAASRFTAVARRGGFGGIPAGGGPRSGRLM